VCPQHAREVRDDLYIVANILKGVTPVWVSLAPSAALSGRSLLEWEQLLVQRGFAGVSLTSWGAVATAKVYAETVKNHGFTLSTACPAAVKLVCTRFPSLLPHLAPVSSPMQNHASWLKKTYGAKVVFIGPCPAKKQEAADSRVVDAALTFSEAEKLIGASASLNTETAYSSFGGEGLVQFPLPGGLAKHVNVPVLSVDGVGEITDFLTRLAAGSVKPRGIIELSACHGSCIGGADAYRRELTLAERKALLCNLDEVNTHASLALRSVYGTSPKVKRSSPSPEEIAEVLTQLGKTEQALEYNCGACGYHTCREKAAAVAAGRAELEMCLPYMRSKAESLANLVLSSTPNAIIVVDKELCVQEWNEAAEHMFGIPALQVLRQPLCNNLAFEQFSIVLEQNRPVYDDKLALAGDLIVAINITPVKGGELALGVFTDITQVEEQAQALAKVRHETLEKAQEVINKQMRVAQEIASLLGETTAESKMLLSKLMKVVQGELA